MNYDLLYFTSMTVSTLGIFLIWHLGLKKLMLDDFRDELFSIRDRLYKLAQEDNEICNTIAYRSLERLINGVIQYAHHFTFLSMLLSFRASRLLSSEAVQNSRFNDVISQIKSTQNRAVRKELLCILQAVSFSIPKYISKSSVPFMFASLAYLILRGFLPSVAKGKQAAVNTFESEAYEAAEVKAYA